MRACFNKNLHKQQLFTNHRCGLDEQANVFWGILEIEKRSFGNGCAKCAKWIGKQMESKFNHWSVFASFWVDNDFVSFWRNIAMGAEFGALEYIGDCQAGFGRRIRESQMLLMTGWLNSIEAPGWWFHLVSPTFPPPHNIPIINQFQTAETLRKNYKLN